MPSQLERLAACEQITEWLTPHDERLIKVTGMQPPIDAQPLREPWRTENPEEFAMIAREVGRLLIPSTLVTKVHATSADNKIGLDFVDVQDWPSILPKSEKTLIFNHKLDAEGKDFFRGHAAIALCGQTIALAVIAMEEEYGVESEEVFLNFLVQPVRQDKFEQIIAI